MLLTSAFAKINLSLEVGPRRADGYHDLETIFQTIDLADELEVEDSDGLHLEVEGDAPTGPENLVLQAARRLAAQAGVRPLARIRLRKRIPSGGGLGGGSSDAAASLLALDRLWRTNLGIGTLFDLAAGLGSDVPFFLLGGTALGLGRGERLYAMTEIPQRPVVLALPGIPVSTPQAFRALDAMREVGSPRGGPPPSPRFPLLWTWEEGALAGLRNDLEPPVFAERPELAAIRELLQGAGAVHARMSGSGSTVYGLFRTDAEAGRGLLALEAAGVRGLLTRTIGRDALSSRRLSSG